MQRDVGENRRTPAANAQVSAASSSSPNVSCCKAVVVKVRYGGDSVEELFPPAAIADSILKWAASPEGFKLTDSEAAKHVLAVCGTDDEWDQAEHIGLFADDDCSVCLDLVPRERFEG